MANEKNLEEVLRQVEELREGLNARIILQPERTSTDFDLNTERGGGFETIAGIEVQTFSGPSGNMIPHIVQYEKSIPLPEKQEASRQGLQKQSSECEYYSGRYLALTALKKKPTEDNRVMKKWAIDLDFRLSLEKTFNDPKENTPYDEPDIENRRKAAEDLKKLIELSNSDKLREIAKKHYHKNEVKEIRDVMGRALYYSPVKIWLHDKENLLNVCCIAAGIAGAVGFGYIMLNQYLK